MRPSPRPIPPTRPGRVLLDRAKWPTSSCAHTRVLFPEKRLKDLVFYFGAEEKSIALVTLTTPANDERRKVVVLDFNIAGVDYCFAEAIVYAPTIDDNLRVRQTQVMMYDELRLSLRRAFRGWNDFSLLDRFLVSAGPVVTVPPPPKGPTPPKGPVPKIYNPKSPPRGGARKKPKK